MLNLFIEKALKIYEELDPGRIKFELDAFMGRTGTLSEDKDEIVQGRIHIFDEEFLIELKKESVPNLEYIIKKRFNNFTFNELEYAEVLLKSKRSLYKFLKTTSDFFLFKDLIYGYSFYCKFKWNRPIILSGDILDMRLILWRGIWMPTLSICVHPKIAEKEILKRISEINTLNSNIILNFLDTLLLNNILWIRGHSRSDSIYYTSKWDTKFVGGRNT